MKLPEPGSVLKPWVIQKHHATNYHWDIRLPVSGSERDLNKYEEYREEKSTEPTSKKSEIILRSWAIPKHKLPGPDEKLLATETEAHPVEYAKFEGEIPEGMYGAGKVEIYDTGECFWIDTSKDKLVFWLRGDEVDRPYAMVRTSQGEDKNNWLLLRSSQVEKDIRTIMKDEDIRDLKKGIEIYLESEKEKEGSMNIKARIKKILHLLKGQEEIFVDVAKDTDKYFQRLNLIPSDQDEWLDVALDLYCDETGLNPYEIDMSWFQNEMEEAWSYVH